MGAQVLRLPRSLLMEVLSGQCRIANLPDDAKIGSVGFDIDRDCAVIVIHSEKYPRLSDYDVIPPLDLMNGKYEPFDERDAWIERPQVAVPVLVPFKGKSQ